MARRKADPVSPEWARILALIAIKEAAG